MTSEMLSKSGEANVGQLAAATLLWLVTFALSVFGPQFLWDGQPLYSALATGINLLAGFFMILANKRFFDGLDELQRKIHFDALAITMGVGVVLGFAYGQMAESGLLEKAHISLLLSGMGLVYFFCVLIGRRRYQ